MNDEVNFKNNPLHGLGLKSLLEEVVEHYGFEILYAYLNINCFKINPSIASSVKFLKKTDWAREKLEGFYLYQFKNLPRPSSEQYHIPPRDRIIPDGQVPGEPAELSIEDAARLQEKRAKKAAEFGKSGSRQGRSSGPYGGGGSSSKRYESDRPGRKDKASGSSTHSSSDSSTSSPNSAGGDPWAAWREK
ncbi:hypothetical protein A3742_07915 [Oleiphilus sp. HI0071]|jgi:uncharacterized protein (DUF2132 family)|nr:MULTISPECIES: VF530 family DNA-binding protein [unclassified Oleiphilus]KZY72620.1 hypothetical protein A3737_10980 [Oleiphilus sp. HI0065]KZY82802.1 hypothetical protein A3742_07915 [Oleiphilus sp. HI0071]KZZ04887.1 hypothetical protein A3744_09455 [Oleiphilus sp. HI0073]KZZ43809.1 hypothetical protein A3758_04295 [Oleiphilus sp. HI0118]KZZ56648.1 hypothetical protein A3760_08375 [Oleiphilus sp. HI0122]KZZ72287.1 hypothetical protein A3765_13260 [Oleiphilus sp. HI0130]KZZ80877.1 hypothet